MTRARFVATYIVLFAFVTALVPAAFGQSIQTLGEIRTSGKVLIESSSGEWLPSTTSYPLLQNTGIKVEDGAAALFFKDGSRIDIDRDSLAIVDGNNSAYTVNLGKGTVAFNITPASSLSIVTPSATVTANVKDSLVQKVSLDKKERILGVISVTDKGTEVRSISGRIVATAANASPRIIASGESILLTAEQDPKIFKAQSFAQTGQSKDKEEENRKKAAGFYWQDGLTAGIAGAVVIGGTIGIGSWVTKGGKRKFASPSGF